MKFVKIILLFAVFVGAIVLVMNWNTIFPKSKGGEEISNKDKININEKCTDFREQWSDSKSWDQELYDRQSGQVEAWNSQNFLSASGYNTLSTVVREQAVRKIDNSYRALLTREAYNHDKLLAVYKGVGYMKGKEQNISSDFQEIDATHSLYLKIKAFVQSKHNITPSFNPETGEWTSFSAQQNKILNDAASYRNNKQYTKLKEIPGFQEGLNADRLRKLTDGMKPEFYKSLSSIIIAEINKTDPTAYNYNRMKKIYEHFANEVNNDKVSGPVYVALSNLKTKLPAE